MGKILCATRGGEEGAATRAAAIDLARELNYTLVFLYVADASFLDRIAAPLVVDVEAELERMGRFQLAMARSQAASAGVEAEAVIRRGRLQAEIITAARDLDATIVVLGKPGGGAPVFDDDALRSFAMRLQNETGAEVRVL
jgi:nucleotide-binding universal stress UspA family protein